MAQFRFIDYHRGTMIEKNFDVPSIANLALREKQIQQSYRPIIAVHKWFARRPGTLFRGLLLAEFADGPLCETFYRGNDLSHLTIADPFMGGGTPLIEANRLGCNIVGYDINPMAYWIVRQELANLDLEAYQQAAAQLRLDLRDQVGPLYQTTCLECGSQTAHVKYFIWVKTLHCERCGARVDLFPGYILARDRRHPRNVLVCATCGELNEIVDPSHPGACLSCSTPLTAKGTASRGRCACAHCGHINRFPQPETAPPEHRMVAIEYYCPACKPTRKGRFFKKPDAADLSKYQAAERTWAGTVPRFVPEDEIPPGDETNRLHRWGYRYYREMFNARQLLGLEMSCRIVAEQPDVSIRNALATNLSDLLRYQNMLNRYDPVALKSLDIFSVHGFPVGLIQCESNLLGIPSGRTRNIGSGGWSNIIAKYARAKDYCDRPFEVQHLGKRKKRIYTSGERIGERSPNESGRAIQLLCESSTKAMLPQDTVDAVFTDPPYYANVQYAELMDFCYVWLRKLAIDDSDAFAGRTTRNEDELTGNDTLGRGLVHFTEGLARAFRRMTSALKPGQPFVFTYHQNTIEGYLPIVVALLDSGLVCSASLPCPAEMAASIHISGTGSSIMDTVFVCRSTGTVPKRTIVSEAHRVADLVREDLDLLQEGGIKTRSGDVRCITFGHLARLAVWHLRLTWSAAASTEAKLRAAQERIDRLGEWTQIRDLLKDRTPREEEQTRRVAEREVPCYDAHDEIPF